jgi:hypothetical protein
MLRNQQQSAGQLGWTFRLFPFGPTHCTFYSQDKVYQQQYRVSTRSVCHLCDWADFSPGVGHSAVILPFFFPFPSPVQKRLSKADTIAAWKNICADWAWVSYSSCIVRWRESVCIRKGATQVGGAGSSSSSFDRTPWSSYFSLQSFTAGTEPGCYCQASASLHSSLSNRDLILLYKQ